MAVTDFSKDVMLDELAGVALWASLHDGDPGTTGADELSTSPYDRQAVVWDPSTGGVVTFDSGTPVVFDVAAGDSVTHGGLWNAFTSGNFIGGDTVANFAFTINGTYTLTTISIAQT